MIRVIPFVIMLFLCSGCATAIYKSGRFHEVLQDGKERSEIRAALGVPIRTGKDQVFNNWPYDEFVVPGPVYDVSLSAGAAEAAGMTLCLSELFAVPQALWWKAFSRHPRDVRVLYKDDAHYTLHIVRPAPKAKDRSDLQNHPAAGNARSALQFAIVAPWPGALEPGC